MKDPLESGTFYRTLFLEVVNMPATILKDATSQVPVLKISVRNLVEFMLRAGDIDDRVGQGDTLEAMQAGGRIHRKIQRSQGIEYHAEVPLAYEADMDSYVLRIEGRADGIIYRELSDDVVIDEIKGMYTDVMRMEEPVAVHLAQAKCYAAIFLRQHGLSEIGVRMTYVNLDTEEIKYFTYTYKAREITDWLDALVADYKKWSDFQFHWRITRNKSIHRLEFPYEYRPGQKQLAADVYRTIVRKKILFAEAPTGTGKTLSMLFPAVKAVGEQKAERIFYLTAKTITRSVARDTFGIFAAHGYRGKTVEITAREKMCLLEKCACNPDDCPYAKGHFDRVNDTLYDLLQQADLMDREQIRQWSMDHQVCPYELSLDLASWCDNILCDYNYVFDPNAVLSSVIGEGSRGDYILLVDEAHNLVDRSREMYSEVLKKDDFLKIRKWFQNISRKIWREAGYCNSEMLIWKKAYTQGAMLLKDIDAFLLDLMRLASCLGDWLNQKHRIEEQDDLLEIYFRIRYFLTISDNLDDHYRIYCNYDGEGSFCIHLFCVDPSEQLQERIDRAVSCIFFSATLLPVNYYKRLLCTDEEPYAVYAQSIFDENQKKLLIGTDVTSRYKQRGDAQYRKMVRYILEVTLVRQGNYIVFCPSYQFMDEVRNRLENMLIGGYDVIAQEQGMDEKSREDFLAEFGRERKHTLVAFCVLGGIFAEGIDLTRDKLIGAIIIGTGLPQVGTVTNLLRDYFDEKGRNGFDYAYLYPGMNKVQQAGGRVIRTREDRGVIVLLDERFLNREYQACFPREWNHYTPVTVDTVKSEVEKFWKQVAGNDTVT